MLEVDNFVYGCGFDSAIDSRLERHYPVVQPREPGNATQLRTGEREDPSDKGGTHDLCADYGY
jgi:hypothetical protein